MIYNSKTQLGHMGTSNQIERWQDERTHTSMYALLKLKRDQIWASRNILVNCPFFLDFACTPNKSWDHETVRTPWILLAPAAAIAVCHILTAASGSAIAEMKMSPESFVPRCLQECSSPSSPVFEPYQQQINTRDSKWSSVSCEPKIKRPRHVRVENRAGRQQV